MDGQRIDGEIGPAVVDAVDVHHGQDETLARAFDVVSDAARARKR